MSMHNLYAKLHDAQMPGTGQILWVPRMAAYLLSWGETPADSIAGYAPGHLAIGIDATDASLTTSINVGSKTVSLFKPILPSWIGTEAEPQTSVFATNRQQWYIRNAAATGTIRSFYNRLYLSGGAGGEALRCYTIVEHAAPVDTCNGAHISLNFGASAGNITGLGTALRATLHCAARAIGGTTAAIQAELYGEASGSVGGNMTLIRAVIDGSDGTAKANLETNATLLSVVCTADTGKLVEVGTGMGTVEGTLKIRVNGALKYLPYYAAPG